MALAWRDAFPELAAMEGEGARLLDAELQAADLPVGAVPFRAGDACRHFLMLVSGSVRVQQLTDQGREIVLYRVEPGETCILTTASALGDAPYEAEAVVEEPTSA
ncbi:MAG: Crp/Fnr family transcriptional regulator, partial [Rhodospirillales bacterium]